MGPLYLLRPRLLGLGNGYRHAPRSNRLAWAFFGLLGLAFWVGLFLGTTYLLDLFYQVEVFGPLITRKLLEILLLGLFTMLLFSNVVTALSTFYLSEDLEFLLAMPVPRPVFHYNRLLETAVQSSWMMALFGLPVFVAYGLVANAEPTYYLLLLVVMPAFTLIPVNVGVVVATILVNLFPARRTRELMALVGILLLVAVLLAIRVLQPERLVDAQAFESLAAYVAELQSPAPALFPPRWASEVLLDASRGRAVPYPLLALLVTGALASTAMGRWLTDRLYAGGWARAQEARAARGARSSWLTLLSRTGGALLPRTMRPLVDKDLRVFFRDPAQWSQVILLVALVAIYLFSVQVFPMDTLRGAWINVWRTAFAFLNLGMTGFVMAGVAVRFQFTAVSAEGRSFWIPRSGPLSPTTFLWAKALPGMVPMVAVGESLAVTSSILLEASLPFVALAAYTGLLLAVGISGIAVAMGAMYPNFKADNAARAAAGPAGVLFMVVSLLLVAVVLALEAVPVAIWIRATTREVPLTTLQWFWTGITLLAASGLCVGAAILPVRYAARRLWARGLP